MNESDAILEELRAIALDETTAGDHFDERLAPVASRAVGLPRAELTRLLLSAHCENPVMGGELIRVASHRDRGSLLAIAESILRLMSYWNDAHFVGEVIDAVLVRAYPELPPLLRSWAAERPGVPRALRLGSGVDSPAPVEDVRWPTDRPLPPLDDTLGVQARLARAGFPVGPFTGEWNTATTRALQKFQYERFDEPTGELDEATLRALALFDGV